LVLGISCVHVFIDHAIENVPSADQCGAMSVTVAREHQGRRRGRAVHALVRLSRAVVRTLSETLAVARFRAKERQMRRGC